MANFKNIEDELLRLEACKKLYMSAVRANGRPIPDASSLIDCPYQFIDSFYKDVPLTYLGSEVPKALDRRGSLYRNNYGYGAWRYLVMDSSTMSAINNQGYKTDIDITFSTKLRIKYARPFCAYWKGKSTVGSRILYNKATSTNAQDTFFIDKDTARYGNIVGCLLHHDVNTATYRGGLHLMENIISDSITLGEEYPTNYEMTGKGEGIQDFQSSLNVYTYLGDTNTISQGLGYQTVVDSSHLDAEPHIYTIYCTSTLSSSGRLYMQVDDSSTSYKTVGKRLSSSMTSYDGYTCTNWPKLDINTLRKWDFTADSSSNTITFNNTHGWSTFGCYKGGQIYWIEVYDHYNDTTPSHKLVPVLHFNWNIKSVEACWKDEITNKYYYRNKQPIEFTINQQSYTWPDSWRNLQVFEIDESE